MLASDYTIFYKDSINGGETWPSEWEWDVYISAYNLSDRVRDTFERARASIKQWIVHPDYQFTTDALPSGAITPSGTSEAEFIQDFFDRAALDLSGKRLCIDITGFMRPHLMYLARHIQYLGIREFDVVYADPVKYTKAERQQFSKGAVTVVRQVSGFEGLHVADGGNRDLLIIGTGYDDRLIAKVAYSKANARKVQMYGLPSLQPDMYQQNVLRASRAEDAVGVDANRYLFAPANDPFVTAQVISEYVARARLGNPGLSNLYLSPLGTKPQTLGFALYYLRELQDSAASIVFPISSGYDQETSKGVSRVWKYRIEL